MLKLGLDIWGSNQEEKVGKEKGKRLSVISSALNSKLHHIYSDLAQFHLLSLFYFQVFETEL